MNAIYYVKVSDSTRQAALELLSDAGCVWHSSKRPCHMQPDHGTDTARGNLKWESATSLVNHDQDYRDPFIIIDATTDTFRLSVVIAQTKASHEQQPATQA